MSFNVETAFTEISKGDSEAFDFCRSFLDFVHCLDDLVDRDKPVDPKVAGHTFLKLIYCLADNRFFQRHKAVLLPIIHTATVEWIDSERLRQFDCPIKKVAAEVLKSSYQSIFFHVAYLCGGIDHQLKMSLTYRDYDFG